MVQLFDWGKQKVFPTRSLSYLLIDFVLIDIRADKTGCQPTLQAAGKTDGGLNKETKYLPPFLPILLTPVA